MTDMKLNPDMEHTGMLVQWLLARSTRIGEEQRLLDEQRPRGLSWDHRSLGVPLPGVACEEMKRRLTSLREEETRLREDLDDWLTAHRDSSKPALGIDALCDQSGLSDDERVILLAATVVAIHEGLGKQILEPLGGGMLTRSDIQSTVQLLDPPDVAGWVKARRYFSTKAPLVRDGLITVEYPTRGCPPGDLMSCTVMVSPRAFSTIVGEPFDDEAQDTDGTPGSRR